MSHQIELVAFDLGNVLCRVNEIPASKIFADLSNRPWQEAREIVFGQKQKNKFERNQITFNEHAVHALDTLGINMGLQEFIELYDSVLVPSEEMYPLVEALAKQIRIALVSNTSEPHWNWADRTLPFSSKFDPVITSYTVKTMKPELDFYNALLNQSGVAAKNILFIDDIPENILSARQMGIRGHQFIDKHSLEQHLQELGITSA